MKKYRKVITGLLIGSMLAGSLAGCGKSEKTAEYNLMANITRETPDVNEINGMSDEERSVAMTGFAVDLFKESVSEDKNVLVSPVSVIYALAMTANGAEGETKTQLEELFGMNTDELNAYLYKYMSGLAVEEKGKLLMANSIWYASNRGFNADKDFLQTNKNWYDAEMYEAEFNDDTKDKINNWVSEHTDDMIPEIIEKMPDDSIMYLVNALSFEGEWAKIYKENNIDDGSFTNSKGECRDVQMMYSKEYSYIEDTNASGFIKPYANDNYAFAAILPDENITLEEYIDGLDGDKLRKLITESKDETVNAAIPKFDAEYDVELSEVLQNLGVIDAFSVYKADFSGMGTLDNPTENIVISSVIHKTKLKLDEKGTKAGAATVVEVSKCETAAQPEIIKDVILDRPFIYMIIDCNDYQPVFIGTMNDIE
ncbi:MAG: serpin family protein [Coprococcus sp.]